MSNYSRLPWSIDLAMSILVFVYNKILYNINQLPLISHVIGYYMFMKFLNFAKDINCIVLVLGVLLLIYGVIKYLLSPYRVIIGYYIKTAIVYVICSTICFWILDDMVSNI